MICQGVVSCRLCCHVLAGRARHGLHGLFGEGAAQQPARPHRCQPQCIVSTVVCIYNFGLFWRQRLSNCVANGQAQRPSSNLITTSIYGAGNTPKHYANEKQSPGMVPTTLPSASKSHSLAARCDSQPHISNNRATLKLRNCFSASALP